MARKKKNDSGGSIAIIAILMLIVIAWATPIVMLVGYLYNRIKAGKIRRQLSGEKSDFWLSDQEKEHFKEKLNQLAEVDKVLEEANQRGMEAGISRNKDGSFSAHSNLGKEIKATLKKYEPMKYEISVLLHELQMLPIHRWDAFNKLMKRAKSFIWAFCCWAMVLAYYAITLEKQSFLEVFKPYLALATNFFRDDSNRISMVSGDIQMIAVATIVAAVSYFAFGLLFKNAGAKYSPIPDKVTLENIDTY